MEQDLKSKDNLTKHEVLELKEKVTSHKKSNNDSSISFNNIIKITYPVIISMFSMNIMIFIDRAFVAKCNLTEFAATMPASNLATTLGSVFTGIIGYCAVLISQYCGAKKYKDCSSTVRNPQLYSIASKITEFTAFRRVTYKLAYVSPQITFAHLT